ncbi:hypothetical protein GF402_00235 [Candidatus Fermentibacteria bacterium]|nr:hypothetical protein [Candidatus Fermentibacteria bacterium]
MKGIAPLVVAAATAVAAFEQVVPSPWLGGGASSALFTHSPLAIASNPATLGLLESSSFAASACRPYGLQPLDRLAAAGSWTGRSVAAGGAITLSGDSDYSEVSLLGGASFRLARGLLLGGSAAARRLQISGYGTASGYSADAGLVYSPLPGVYGTTCIRGLVRTGLGESGDPACPRSLDVAVGVCPAERVTAAVGLRRREGFGPEVSLFSGFSPVPAVRLGGAMLTDPLRFTVSLSLSVSSAEISYGLSHHSTLPATHLVSLCWGGGAFRPEPIPAGDHQEGPTEVSFPLDVNAATEEQLQAIPGVGPVKASAIRAFVLRNGPVASVDELIDAPGVGPSLLEVLRQYLVVP